MNVPARRWMMALSGLLICPLVVQADSLERAYMNKGRLIIDHLKGNGYKNVGVLKFHVKKGGELMHNAGALNVNAARRLEVALVFKNDLKNPVGIIRNANRTAAAKLKGITHLTKEGRQLLFADKSGKPRRIYLPAWGDKDRKVSADAMITGVIEMHDDLKNMTVHLLVFDSKNPKLRRLIPPFKADVDPETLIETSSSFNLRSLKLQNGQLVLTPLPAKGDTPAAKKDEPKVKPKDTPKPKPVVATKENTEEAIRQEVAAVKKGKKPNPLQDNPPVDIGIRYDGVKQKIQFANGEAFVAPPKEGQRVVFVLRRKDNKFKDKYGVVLMVNGVNTLDEQRNPPSKCRRWILPLNRAPMIIDGFYNVGKDGLVKGNAFVVVPPSKDLKLEYGENLGIVTFCVFRENFGVKPKPKKDVPPEVKIKKQEENEVLDAIESGDFPDDLPRSINSLITRLRANASSDTPRGIITKGQQLEGGNVQVETFRNPGQVMGVTIRYSKK